uniref:ABC transporter domain-containing protein n=1 Tax=Rhizochromulina marina TaxID=1034831 RepID=A0A7S2R4V8_9STRA|mmetsp:Transcript_10874/g.31153  ORF Transcript_10874/g.31153 Transcript_10874/m.31153 type:complete len:766 (+) Transcript_10874:134-2431(+)
MEDPGQRAAAAAVLEGVDEDLIDYICSVVSSGDLEAVPPFLISAGAAETDAEAEALCARLQAALALGGAEDESLPPPVKDDGDVPVLLKAPVSMGGGESFSQSSSKQMMTDFLWGTDKVRRDMNSSMETAHVTNKRTERRAARELEKARLRFEAAAAQSSQANSQITRMAMPEFDGQPRDRDIRVAAFDINFGGRTLLSNAELRLSYGRRYGLMGKNGVGKTTLLQHMAAFDIPGFPRHHRVLHVRQEAAASDVTVLDTVLSADVELITLLQEEKALSQTLDSFGDEAPADKVSQTSEKLQQVYERLRFIDADGAEGRASSILSGLGFSETMKQTKLNDLSGGWRVRTALAGALFIQPHLLMLDEPTNHLDLEAVLWLQDYLQSYKHTVLVVSHDRTFLNEVCTDIVLFQDLGLHYYKGDFDTFERTQSDQLTNQKKVYEAYTEKRQHMQEFVDKFRANAKRASMVQSRIKAIEKMDAEAPPEPTEEAVFRFSFPVPEPLGRPILQLEEAAFSYSASLANPDAAEAAKASAAPVLFRDVDFGVEMDTRIGIVGKNGCGKSTLLNLLLGNLRPTEGQVHIKPTARIKVFTQHHSDMLSLAYSPIENLMQMFPKDPEAALRSHLGKFDVSGDMAIRPCSSLSGGQKSRVVFAALAYSRPHIIVMDEPTNHLDIQTIDALIHAVRDFRGGVILVSHDQHFINKVCNEIWVVADCSVRRFDGGFNEYKATALRQQRDAAARGGTGQAGGGGGQAADRDGAAAGGGAGGH